MMLELWLKGGSCALSATGNIRGRWRTCCWQLAFRKWWKSLNGNWIDDFDGGSRVAESFVTAGLKGTSRRHHCRSCGRTLCDTRINGVHTCFVDDVGAVVEGGKLCIECDGKHKGQVEDLLLAAGIQEVVEEPERELD
mmetsp:Transcript_117095/g.268812  ORF Transcript_117095/g.268812 Transcript_117095/m.268812 type:complete len:138 (+) Transcript_117095:120-533(+)